MNCQAEGLDIEDFWKDNEILRPQLYKLLLKVKEEINWGGPKVELLKRIRKLGKSTTFTVREVKLLRKLINQQKREGYTDFKAVLYYFPGKSLKMVRNKYNEKYRHAKET
jgi:hypothetical protein